VDSTATRGAAAAALYAPGTTANEKEASTQRPAPMWHVGYRAHSASEPDARYPQGREMATPGRITPCQPGKEPP